MDQKGAVCCQGDSVLGVIARWAAGAERIGTAASHRLAADYLFDLAGELFEVEGLGQEVDVAVAVEALAEGVFGVAGDEDDLHLGVALAQPSAPTPRPQSNARIRPLKRHSWPRA